MLKSTINDVHVCAEKVLMTPEKLSQLMPLPAQSADFIRYSRKTISDIIHGKDQRLMVITGPCSIHDIKAAKAYALKLKEVQQKFATEMFVVMRVYFEKPRTTVGWKGFINDPHMDDSFDIEAGLKQARELLLFLAELEIPVATEALDPISPQYLGELFSWAAIGARTAESQTHREMASGLSMPVGFKNGTDGSLDIAINAMESAASPHSFIGINRDGQVAIINTEGNPDGHVILRGGKIPNYESSAIKNCQLQLNDKGLNPSVIVDCSHGNSNKDFTRQPFVAMDVVNQIVNGNRQVIGVMLESHLKAGQQKLVEGKADQLEFGLSITDACIGWETTEQLLEEMYHTLESRTVALGAA